jgi:hypothetical protein
MRSGYGKRPNDRLPHRAPEPQLDVVRNRDGKKIADAKSQADAWWWIDSQEPERRRQAGDPDSQLLGLIRRDKLRAEIERLREALRECADELEVVVEDRYRDTKGYPSEKRRYERDIAPVLKARDLLSR